MGEMIEWRCMECGHEVYSTEKPPPIKWDDSHVGYFAEYKEPDYSELDPARHQQKMS